mgnify:CR=1 FL=1
MKLFLFTVIVPIIVFVILIFIINYLIDEKELKGLGGALIITLCAIVSIPVSFLLYIFM